ncbi:hypothetical protein IW140_003528 [Coemansia sp. RSA 1813]|nr:hypothetical protein EV178_003383 [Coemansia sp. RSA 1646]KAJ1772943.1 hypothetical protein LPJ74_001084 [Coemansia sp. RSA 1843]KAJ2093519.1 hypothetical protein IW138_000372 [Coemansia sp. RSA 986]KAJ2214336.1 hypothetical protein EV179_003118 [Coemansia sp. RSA 487]KAJ2568902.1 hypothetical protein IW140_003528 [Coemansia sp. RSA 1813]
MSEAVKRWSHGSGIFASNESISNKSFETIELWGNGSLVLTIHYAEKVDIKTIGDIKAYAAEMTRVPKENIVLCHVPTATVYNDKHNIPQESVQMFAVNILRVDVYSRFGRRVEGIETIYVNADGLIFNELKRHGFVLKRKFVLFGRHIVSADRDTFRHLDAKNGSVFYLRDINKQVP